MITHAPSSLRAPVGASPAWLAERKAGTTPAIRRDLVNRVRAEIAAGIYDTEERFEAAMAKLFLSIDLD